MLRIVFFALIGTLPLPAAAHELWISPVEYRVAEGTTIVADFRNGENFVGTQLAFFDRSSTRLQVAGPDGVIDLTPRNGDRPAIDIDAGQAGLHVLAYETTPSRLTYKDWAKWMKFVDHKDLNAVAAAHAARGLPQEDFKEGYTRHAKALVAVGSGDGQDTALGLETEIVALTNPYASNFDQNMKIEVLYQGRPRTQAQVEIFERAPSGDVTVTLTKTDDKGQAVIPTQPGHTYLLDAVLLREPIRDVEDIAWETLWAALTFQVPPR